MFFCCLIGKWFPVGLGPALASQPLPPSLQNKLGMNLRLIPGGVYLMGSPVDEAGRYLNEGPEHKVTLTSFYLTEKEITNAQYGKFLDATHHTPPLYWLDKNVKFSSAAGGGCHLA